MTPQISRQMRHRYEQMENTFTYRTHGRTTTTTTTTTATKLLIIVTLHKVTGALYISDFFFKRWYSSQKSVVRQLKQMGRKAVERPSNRNRIVVVTITALSTDVPAFIIVVIITGLQRVFCLLWRAVYGQLEHACFRQISVSVEMLSQVAGLSHGRCQFGPRELTSADNALMVTTTIRFRFDGLSTAFRTSQGLSDVTHQWPLTR